MTRKEKDKEETICQYHEALCTDIRWLVRIGRVVLVLISSLLVALIPISLQFNSYMRDLHTTIALTQDQIKHLKEMQDKLERYHSPQQQRIP